MIRRLRDRIKNNKTLKKPEYLRFNLLPKEYLERRKQAAFRLLRVLVFGLIIAAVVFVTLQQYITLREYEAATLEAEAELQEYAEALQIEQELAVYRQEYENRQRLVFDKAMPVPIHEVMLAISDSVPHTVAVTEFDVARNGGLIIHGRTDSLYDVSHFASVLRNLEYLPEPFTTFPRQFDVEAVEGRIHYRMEIPWSIPDGFRGDAQ